MSFLKRLQAPECSLTECHREGTVIVSEGVVLCSIDACDWYESNRPRAAVSA